MLPADTARAAILGTPLNPGKQPSPSGVVRAFEQMDARILANSAGALVVDTHSDLSGLTSPAANIMVWVMSGSQAGVYQNTGTSGAPAWTRRGDLPYGVIKAINVGAGTANAIVATSAIPVPSADGAALIILPIVATNDASPVTVAFNGGSTLTIKSNTGNDIAIGGLQSGMLVLGFKSGSTFRIITDQVSSAIIAEVEALLEDFESKYLGSFANDTAATAAAGTPQEGQLYWNTTESEMRVWDGAWQTFAGGVADGSITEPKLAPSLTQVLSSVSLDKAALASTDHARFKAGLLAKMGMAAPFVWDGSDLSGSLLGSDITSTTVSTDTITKAAHGLRLGMTVVPSTTVNGVTAGQQYYVIRVDADNFRLATTFANALAGTAVDFTGTTNFTVNRHLDPAQAAFVPPASDLTGASGAWRNLYREELDLRHFGALGNNESYDTEALLRAIYYTEPYGQSRAIFIPVGEFRIAPNAVTILNNVRLIGVNRHASSLFMAGAGELLQLGDGSVSLNNISLENLGLYGDGVFTQNAIKLNNANNVTLRDVLISNFGNGGTGVYGVSANDYALDIERTWITACHIGVYATSAGGNALSVRSSLFTSLTSAGAIVQAGVATRFESTIFEDIHNATPNDGVGVSIVGATGPVVIDTCYFEETYQDIKFSQATGCQLVLRGSYFTSGLTGQAASHMNLVPAYAEFKMNRFHGRDYAFGSLSSAAGNYEITLNQFGSGYSGVVSADTSTPSFGLLQDLNGAVTAKGLTVI